MLESGLGTVLKVVDLLGDQLLDLLSHDRLTRFDHFLRLSCLVLEHEGTLPLQGSNQFL